jgi:hypothetical protein
MTDAVDHVIEVSRRLLQLRERLAQLDGERAEIEAQIAHCLSDISTTAAQAPAAARIPAVAQAPAPAVLDHRHLLPDRVLSLLNHYPERSFGAFEIAQELGSLGGETNIRMVLARMAKDGRVVRVSYGRYSAAARV